MKLFKGSKLHLKFIAVKEAITLIDLIEKGSNGEIVNERYKHKATPGTTEKVIDIPHEELIALTVSVPTGYVIKRGDLYVIASITTGKTFENNVTIKILADEITDDKPASYPPISIKNPLSGEGVVKAKLIDTIGESVSITITDNQKAKLNYIIGIVNGEATDTANRIIVTMQGPEFDYILTKTEQTFATPGSIGFVFANWGTTPPDITLNVGGPDRTIFGLLPNIPMIPYVSLNLRLKTPSIDDFWQFYFVTEEFFNL